MVLNVTSLLLSHQPENAQTLSGEAIIPNIHPASKYPPGSKVGSLNMRAIPGHSQFVMYPYAKDHPASAKRCRDLGRRCCVDIEVEVSEISESQVFWRLLKEHTGGLPGQKDIWRGPSQRTKPFNPLGDHVRIFIGNPDLLWLYISAADSQQSPERAERLQRFSWLIQNQMDDQNLGGEIEKNSDKGWTITVEKVRTQSGQDAWPEEFDWVKQQAERLQMIISQC